MKTIKLIIVFFLACTLGGCQAIKPYQIKKPTYFEVQVVGALHNPGSFKVEPYASIKELLEQVDLKVDADVEQLNPYNILHHHDKITIPFKSETACININHASLDGLITLPSIGPAIAQRIIDHRQNVGLFQYLEDIMLIKGIKIKTFEKIKDKICL